jgi:adenylate kinase family enzyme
MTHNNLIKLAQHIIVTGHSGSGKSTLSRKLGEEHGLPIVELDQHPAIKEMLAKQKEHFQQHGTFDLSNKGKKYERSMINQAIKEALGKPDRHIVEGSYFLERNPNKLSKYERHLVDVPEDVIIEQRIQREAAKRIAKGLEPDNEGVAQRGRILLERYRPGVDAWRSHADVVKHTRK